MVHIHPFNVVVTKNAWEKKNHHIDFKKPHTKHVLRHV